MFIDLHTHILPGLDDGAQTMEDALAMAEMAVQNGTTIVVATPHVRTGRFNNCKEDILAAVANINSELSKAGSELLVLPGAEYSLEPNLSKRLEKGELLTINNLGRHLMVELPSILMPEYTENILYEIQLQGVTPIIAHPERNHVFRRYPKVLQAYTNRGVLAQVTTSSITGWFGQGVRKTALQFIRLGLVQIIASDGHTVAGRVPVMNRAYELVRRKWGQEYAQTMVYGNPSRIINSDVVETCSVPPRQPIWNRFIRQKEWS